MVGVRTLSRFSGGRSRWIGVFLSVPAGLAAVCLYMTEPRPVPGTPRPAASLAPVPTAPVRPVPLVWPVARLEGVPAKRLLLDLMRQVDTRLERVPGYTATFLKRERIADRLLPPQTIEMKVRNQPFAVYLKYLKPTEGREVIYAEGEFDNHMIAHESGLARRLIPRLKVLPTSPLALAESRHPITDIGLFHLVDKLLRYRKIELADPAARTVLDWYTDEQGRRWARSVHERDGRDSGYPFPLRRGPVRPGLVHPPRLHRLRLARRRRRRQASPRRAVRVRGRRPERPPRRRRLQPIKPGIRLHAVLTGCVGFETVP